MNHRYLAALAVAAMTVHAAEPEDEGNIEEITVVATRSRQLVRDQPVRVEVVPQEELEESQTVAPGNLTNLLNELAGARMDSPSAGLGGTSLRLRGMPGRHAQVLSDGLALSGAQTDSFSLLQVPPMDLARVEVVKGVASALYGGSALAGVLNLVSRPPDGRSQWLVSHSSLGGSDADLFVSGPKVAPAGFTLAGSAHYQPRRDADHDGWAEIPGYERLTARPRWFFDNGGRQVFATIGLIGEHREGGTMPGHALPSAEPFPVALDTRHIDAGMVASFSRDDGSTLGAKWSAVRTRHERQFGAADIADTSTNVAAEATWQSKKGSHDWTLGAAVLHDELSVPEVAGIGYSYTVPGLFAQDEFSPVSWLAVSASARVDFHEDGTFVSPRLSALFRLDPDLSLRASLGTGYAPVTPLVDEIEDIGFGALDPLTGLRAERASSGSLDLKWAIHPLEINLSAFASEVRHVLDAGRAPQPQRVTIVNDREPLEIRGAELLVGCLIDDMHLLVSSTYMNATEEAPAGGRRAAELMPKLAAEVAAIFELEGRGRAGFEISYTGPQTIHDDPYLATTPSFFEINALAEWRVRSVSVFVNAMNLTGEHQQDHAPLLRPAQAPGLGANPVVDAWAPLIGRYFSLGVRGSF
jgi:iron complex outermembrane receptor protein